MLTERLRALDIRSPIQKKTVEILYTLQGYSKRSDLLRDQLMKELARDGIGPVQIEPNLAELVDLRLVKEKNGNGSIRIALNKDIWDLDPAVINFVCKATDHFSSVMRSDAQFSGVLRKVKTEIKESKKLPVELGHSVFEILVCCALRRNHDWKLVNGRFVRKGEDIEVTNDLVQQELPINVIPVKAMQAAVTQEKPVPIRTTLVKHDEISLPKDISFDPANMDTILPKELIEAFSRDSVRFFGATATIDIPLSLGRRQRVYVTLRRNTAHEKVFWLYSICGTIDAVQKIITSIVWHNNECSPFKVTILEMASGTHVGVCTTLATDTGWERHMPTIIRNLAAFGDRLEELHWSQDKF